MGAKRNAGIELYRVILTFGIVLLHAMTTCGHVPTGVCARGSYFLYSCVVGFVFISGWFGIKSNVMRILKVWGVAVYAAAVMGTVDVVLNGWRGFDIYFRILTGNWFLNGYTVLILFAPLVNLAIETRKYRALFGLAGLVFGWAFLLTVPHVRDFIPRSAGVVDYSGVTLLGIYAMARMMRVCDVESRLTLCHKSCLLGLSLVAIACHLSSYASPFAFALSGIVFLWFKNRTLTSKVERAVFLLAPSMFTIFMLHANSVGFSLMDRMIDWFVGIGVRLNVSLVLTAGAAFCVGCLLDVPRRVCRGCSVRLRKSGIISSND